MMQNQQVPMTFQRYETKYMLSPIMARKLRKSLPGHLQMDEYGLDTICSLYYDITPMRPTGAPMHWGHAVSTDLLHWEYKKTSIFFTFTSSAVESSGCPFADS